MAPALPPALRFVMACSVWPASAEQRAKILSLRASGVEEGRLARTAVRHGVAALVTENMRRAGMAIPDDLLKAARRRGQAALRQAGETLRLQSCLVAADIPVLSLKGASLAQRAYGEIGIRDAADIDLVIAPQHLERAWQVMAGAGYRRVRPARCLSADALRLFVRCAKDSVHRHERHGFVVELHWRLSDDLTDPQLPPPSRWQRIALSADGSLATLRDEDLFSYLCTHGAAHLWARLKWLADVGALVRSSGDGGARYWRAACASGAESAAASAFRLLHAFMDTPLPPGFPETPSRRVRLLNWLALKAMAAGEGERDLAGTAYRGWAEFAGKLLIAPGIASRLALLRRLLISAEDVGALALPPMLGFLYPIVRIPRLMARRRRRSAARGEA